MTNMHPKRNGAISILQFVKSSPDKTLFRSAEKRRQPQRQREHKTDNGKLNGGMANEIGGPL